MSEIPTIEKRRLQAAVIKPIYAEMVEALGEEKARQILDSAIRKAAISEAAEFAAGEPDGRTTMASFVDLYRHWTAGGALEMTILEQSDEKFDFDVTRCRYAEMYHEMGLGKIGHLMSCNRDGSFCQGYDPNIKLERAQTIMDGASHCTFRYRYEPE